MAVPQIYVTDWMHVAVCVCVLAFACARTCVHIPACVRVCVCEKGRRSDKCSHLLYLPRQIYPTTAFNVASVDAAFWYYGVCLCGLAVRKLGLGAVRCWGSSVGVVGLNGRLADGARKRRSQ